MVDTNEACKPSQHWILLVGLGSLVWAWLKTVCLIMILGLENNNSFPTLKSLPTAARLPVIFQSKLLSTRQCKNLSQLLFTLGVHYEAIPLPECNLHGLGYVHRLNGLARCETMLSIDNPERAVLDFVPRSWLSIALGHYAQCLPCRSVWHVQEVVPHLFHASFLVGANCPVNWCDVKLVSLRLTTMSQELPCTFYWRLPRRITSSQQSWSQTRTRPLKSCRPMQSSF